MPKYRKRPLVIEAVQYNRPPDAETQMNILALLDGTPWRQDAEHITIMTLEGDMTVSDGDWIIKGISGEAYPCKPDIFERTYELVEEHNA